MKNLPRPSRLKHRTRIDIIAPAGKIYSPAALKRLRQPLEKQGYAVHYGKHILDPLDRPIVSHTAVHRRDDLKKALFNPDSSIIWCYRGGSGSAELLPLLEKLEKDKKLPPPPKIFLGFSDLTALLVFFEQRWQYPVYHGPTARQWGLNTLGKTTQKAVLQLFQDRQHYKPQAFINFTDFTPLNKHARCLSQLEGIFTGGNLTVISHAMGTPYRIYPAHKILMLEDINEPAYKIRRMLVQLDQSGVFHKLQALILGNFILTPPYANPKEKTLIQDVLQIFAKIQPFPVFYTKKIGHGKENIPLPLGVPLKF